MASPGDGLKIFIHSTHRIRCRYISLGMPTHILSQVSMVLKELKMLDGEHITEIISVYSKTKRNKSIEPHFSNMCGKIMHHPHPNLVREGVRPLFQRIQNGFGRFDALYSRYCNLIMYDNRECTLFRGGRDTAEIDLVIRHSICDSCILSNTMHMMVASSGSGRSISMRCNYMLAMLTSDTRWKANAQECVENESCRNFRLHNFDSAWLETLCPGDICRPKTILLSVSIAGNINLFITPEQPVVFEVGVEAKILPIVSFFCAFITDMH